MNKPNQLRSIESSSTRLTDIPKGYWVWVRWMRIYRKCHVSKNAPECLFDR